MSIDETKCCGTALAKSAKGRHFNGECCQIDQEKHSSNCVRQRKGTEF